MKFDEIFRDLMVEKDITIQDISKITGIEDSVLYDYTHGSIPKLNHAVSLANYFKCSLDFLMGLRETPNDVNFKLSYDISLFSTRYDNLLVENKITHYRLSKCKNLNYSSHYTWRRGAVPSMQSLIIIAQYFDVSIDYLVGRSDEK